MNNSTFPKPQVFRQPPCISFNEIAAIRRFEIYHRTVCMRTMNTNTDRHCRRLWIGNLEVYQRDRDIRALRKLTQLLIPRLLPHISNTSFSASRENILCNEFRPSKTVKESRPYVARVFYDQIRRKGCRLKCIDSHRLHLTWRFYSSPISFRFIFCKFLYKKIKNLSCTAIIIAQARTCDL